MRFSLITTPYGLQIPIVAMIKTKDLSGVLVGSNEKEKSEKIAKLTKSNSVDVDEMLLKTIWNFGENVVVPANTTLNIVLAQPITITPIQFK